MPTAQAYVVIFNGQFEQRLPALLGSMAIGRATALGQRLALRS
jgi:hypothetical protein